MLGYRPSYSHYASCSRKPGEYEQLPGRCSVRACPFIWKLWCWDHATGDLKFLLPRRGCFTPNWSDGSSSRLRRERVCGNNTAPSSRRYHLRADRQWERQCGMPPAWGSSGRMTGVAGVCAASETGRARQAVVNVVKPLPRAGSAQGPPSRRSKGPWPRPPREVGGRRRARTGGGHTEGRGQPSPATSPGVREVPGSSAPRSRPARPRRRPREERGRSETPGLAAAPQTPSGRAPC